MATSLMLRLLQVATATVPCRGRSLHGRVHDLRHGAGGLALGLPNVVLAKEKPGELDSRVTGWIHPWYP